MIMPRTAFLIRASCRQVAVSDFQSLAPGSDANLSGEYAYMILYDNGPVILEPNTPLRTFRVDRDGTITLE